MEAASSSSWSERQIQSSQWEHVPHSSSSSKAFHHQISFSEDESDDCTDGQQSEFLRRESGLPLRRQVETSSSSSPSAMVKNQVDCPFGEATDDVMDIKRLTLEDNPSTTPNLHQQRPIHIQLPNRIPNDGLAEVSESPHSVPVEADVKVAHQVCHQGPRSTAVVVEERRQFLVFIKILFKCLDQANGPKIRDKAKKIVAECTKRNRQGDPNFHPLLQAVEFRLRRFVGEIPWRKSLLLLKYYQQTREQKMNQTMIPDHP